MIGLRLVAAAGLVALLCAVVWGLTELLSLFFASWIKRRKDVLLELLKHHAKRFNIGGTPELSLVERRLEELSPEERAMAKKSLDQLAWMMAAGTILFLVVGIAVCSYAAGPL